MTDLAFKTPPNLNKDFVTNSSSKSNHAVHRTPPEDTGQNVSLRRSARNIGKDSVVKNFQLSSQKMYPGSGSKPRVIRSFRTPIQTIPLKVVDRGADKKNASKSFAMVPDEEYMVTPRSNIEGFLTVAESEPRTDSVFAAVSQRAGAVSSANKSLKMLKNSDHVSRQGKPYVDFALPDSILTPRTNIWNILDLDQTHTPAVTTSDLSDQPSNRTRVSDIMHQGWGQKVSLSPMYHSDASEDVGDSPISKKYVATRNRRSFHITSAQSIVTAPQSSSLQTLGEDMQTTVSSGDLGSANNIESLSATVLSEKHTTPISSKDVYSSKTPISSKDVYSSKTPISSKDVFSSKTPISSKAFYSSKTKIISEDVDSSKTPISSKDVFSSKTPISSEDVYSSKTPISSEDVYSSKTSISSKDFYSSKTPISSEDVYSSKTPISSEDVFNSAPDFAENIPNVATESENIVTVENSGNTIQTSNEEERFGAVSRLSTTEDIAVVKAKNMDTEMSSESVARDQISLDAAIDEELDNAGDITNAVVNVDNRNNSEATDVVEAEVVETNLEEELRTDKNRGGNRTILTRRHGEISFMAIPKNILNNTHVPSTPTASVYDLSYSSEDMQSPRRKPSSQSPVKGLRSASAQKKLSAAKGRSASAKTPRQSMSSSKNRSNLSYSEWKSAQKGNDNSRQSINSFFDIPPPRSSTPSDRSKKVLNSTKMQKSVVTVGDQISKTLAVDSISDISPIRPDVTAQRLNRTGSRQTMLVLDSDKGGYGIADVEGETVGHNERSFRNQQEIENDDNVDASEDDSLGLSPLKTPHIDMDKRKRTSLVAHKSLQKQLDQREASGSGQKRKRETEKEVNRRSTKRTKTASQLTALPRRSVKFFAERHTTMRLSKDSIEEIETASELFWDNTFKSLESLALHAGRKIINEQDVILLMKTQRLIKDTEDIYDEIRGFLPMELRSELIPMALP